MALKQYKLKHKTYPDSILQLVPEVLTKLPLNPFSGENYQYQRKGDGFIITAEGSDVTWESKR